MKILTYDNVRNRINIEVSVSDKCLKILNRLSEEEQDRVINWINDYPKHIDIVNDVKCLRICNDLKIKIFKPEKEITTFQENEIKENINILHERGLSNKEIADKLGFPQSTIHYYVQRLGLTNNYWNKHKKFDEKRFLRLYKKRKTDNEISEIMGYTQPAITYQRQKRKLKSNYVHKIRRKNI